MWSISQAGAVAGVPMKTLGGGAGFELDAVGLELSPVEGLELDVVGPELAIGAGLELGAVAGIELGDVLVAAAAVRRASTEMICMPRHAISNAFMFTTFQRGLCRCAAESCNPRHGRRAAVVTPLSYRAQVVQRPFRRRYATVRRSLCPTFIENPTRPHVSAETGLQSPPCRFAQLRAAPTHGIPNTERTTYAESRNAERLARPCQRLRPRDQCPH